MWRRIWYRVVFFLEVLNQLSNQLKQLILFWSAALSLVDQLLGQREHTLVLLFCFDNCRQRGCEQRAILLFVDPFSSHRRLSICSFHSPSPLGINLIKTFWRRVKQDPHGLLIVGSPREEPGCANFHFIKIARVA